MKNSIKTVVLMLVFVSLAGLTSLKPQNANSLEGTWELINRYNWKDGNVTDTLPNTNGYRQVKIYSKDKVMWTRYSPDDPNEWFGYGSYTNTEDRLEERLEYGSKVMMAIQDTIEAFRFELQLDKDTYSQITIDEEGNRTFSENYRRID
ncbi:hypothetical protein [Pareuzebyella sediminis]|uniref:hypothetical protein n=1 Tax=Pareuzebyella sediminis TaxID=2607998 RepID=UPI0011ED55CD|nr:hypothetical protein [Pareuzebyella sediminis]